MGIFQRGASTAVTDTSFILVISFCVCVYEPIYMCTCTCWCPNTHILVEIRGQCQESYSAPRHLFQFNLWDSVSRWSLSIWQDQLILKPQGFACLHNLLSTGIAGTSWHTWHFMWVEGIPNSHPHVALQVPDCLSCLPSLLISTPFKLGDWCGPTLFSLLPIPLNHQDHIHVNLQNAVQVQTSNARDPGLKDHNLQY